MISHLLFILELNELRNELTLYIWMVKGLPCNCREVRLACLWQGWFISSTGIDAVGQKDDCGRRWPFHELAVSLLTTLEMK